MEGKLNENFCDTLFRTLIAISQSYAENFQRGTQREKIKFNDLWRKGENLKLERY